LTRPSDVSRYASHVLTSFNSVPKPLLVDAVHAAPMQTAARARVAGDWTVITRNRHPFLPAFLTFATAMLAAGISVVALDRLWVGTAARILSGRMVVLLSGRMVVWIARSRIPAPRRIDASPMHTVS
jgi:hypothetical protein